jgi:hypothetical protein
MRQIAESPQLIDRAQSEVAASGTTLDELLDVLDEERETYFRQHYASSQLD